jgi:hypothetical protein
MAEPHVLTGLLAKRAEIAGKIEHLQDELRQLVIDLDHIDASIHFLVAIELQALHARPVPAPHHAFRGQVTRTVITALRNAKKPHTTQDIAQRVMAERGLDTANVRLLKTMKKRAGGCLRNLQKQGRVSRQPDRSNSCSGSMYAKPA